MDIYLFENKNLSDSDKLEILDNIFIPSENFKFPSRLFGKQGRKFSRNWLQNYNWLIYSEKEDSAYCKYCFLFANRDLEVGMYSGQPVGQFVKDGFTDWKNATLQFKKHALVK